MPEERNIDRRCVQFEHFPWHEGEFFLITISNFSSENFTPSQFPLHIGKSNYFNVNNNPTDATVCRYLFTAKLLYMFRVSQHPSSGVLKTVPAAGTGHTTCTATPLQRGLIGTGLRLAQTSPDQTTLEGSSGASSMSCTGGCGYSF